MNQNFKIKLRKFVILLPIWIIFVCLTIQFDPSHASPVAEVTKLECNGDLTDLTNHGWHVTSSGDGAEVPLKFAQSSSDLPGILAGNLRTNGTSYLQGQGPVKYFYIQSAVWPQVPLNESVYVYLKYYGHFETLGVQKMSVGGMIEGGGAGSQEHLPESFGFTWRESLVTLRSFPSHERPFIVEIGMQGFYDDEYFFLEKVIVAQSLYYQTLHDIKNLCFSK